VSQYIRVVSTTKRQSTTAVYDVVCESEYIRMVSTTQQQSTAAIYDVVCETEYIRMVSTTQQQSTAPIYDVVCESTLEWCTPHSNRARPKYMMWCVRVVVVVVVGLTPDRLSEQTRLPEVRDCPHWVVPQVPYPPYVVIASRCFVLCALPHDVFYCVAVSVA
jgi:hypothetical protein